MHIHASRRAREQPRIARVVRAWLCWLLQRAREKGGGGTHRHEAHLARTALGRPAGPLIIMAALWAGDRTEIERDTPALLELSDRTAEGVRSNGGSYRPHVARARRAAR
eukprot:5915590-Prymnesium_polylepis.3